ncbi:MAG: GTP-binding protein, partial [Clostridia bacterium]|nr:GTP-binding protein [Clostridia bacterium]
EDCDCHEHHHHHDEDCDCHEHHHHHNEDCECHEHHHHHDEDCECHEHHHHHGEDCDCHEHHHHDDHHHDENCTCGCHDHDHHHHHADEVFTSWGVETTKKFSMDQIKAILCEFAESDKYGMVLRAKGIVQNEDGSWIHFDYVPGEPDVRKGSADVIGRLCVIGAKLDKEAIAERFGA